MTTATNTNKRQPPKHAPHLKGGLETNRSNQPKNTTRLQLGGLKPRKLLALDTETTGTDFWHGCRPFFVSTMDEGGELRYWEWDVDPTTRSVIFPKEDRFELQTLIKENDFVLHNTKFDARGLSFLGCPLRLYACHDTLVASHALLSNESHKLKDLALQYLNVNDDDQNALRTATNEARRIARGLGWAIAEDGGHEHFPAQLKAPKEGWWVYDTWLPRAIAKAHSYAPDHPWWTVLSAYALRDVERTYGLWRIFKEELEKQNLWEVYLERRKQLATIYRMETNGVQVSRKRLIAVNSRLAKEADAMAKKCRLLADKKIDNLDSPKQLEGVMYGYLGIKPGKRTKSGKNYSTDAETLQTILQRLDDELVPPRTGCKGTVSSPKKNGQPATVILTPNQSAKAKRARDFVWNLLGYRGRVKTQAFFEDYMLRGLLEGKDWLRLHGSINPTGTDTLRGSMSGPNLQQVAKGKSERLRDDPIPSVREVFGPRQGREWFSIDYSNIELRIFAYASGDQGLIDAYEQDFAVHCIFAELLFEEEYKACRREAEGMVSLEPRPKGASSADLRKLVRKKTEGLFKTRYENTLYQWTKNGDFALIYGAGEEKADRTYHRPGAYRLIRQRMPKIDEFMRQKNHEASVHKYVKCIGGYHLWVPEDEPHVACNYFVQGTARWCMVLAMNRVDQYLEDLNRSVTQAGGDGSYQMILDVHDELDFDFPIHPRNDTVIRKVGALMEQSGVDIGIPTPVEIERHRENWSVGEKVSLAL